MPQRLLDISTALNDFFYKQITFEESKLALHQKQTPYTQILPFVTQDRSSVPNLQHILIAELTFNSTTAIA